MQNKTTYQLTVKVCKADRPVNRMYAVFLVGLPVFAWRNLFTQMVVIKDC